MIFRLIPLSLCEKTNESCPKKEIQYNTVQYIKIQYSKIQHNKNTDLLMSLLLSSESAVSLLPEEFPGPQERLRMFELPSDDVTPLIQLDRQISVRLNPGGVGWVHNWGGNTF